MGEESKVTAESQNGGQSQHFLQVGDGLIARLLIDPETLRNRSAAHARLDHSTAAKAPPCSQREELRR